MESIDCIIPVPQLRGSNGARNAPHISAFLERLRRQSIDCQLISDFASEPYEQELFARLAVNLHVIATEMQEVITAQQTAEATAEMLLLSEDRRGRPRTRLVLVF